MSRVGAGTRRPPFRNGDRMRTTFTLVLILILARIAQAQCQYEVESTEPYQCSVSWSWPFEATALNNLGAWAGWRPMCPPGIGYVAVYCPSGGTPQTLPMPPGTGPWGARATGVNDAGVVVGHFSPGSDITPQIGCIWWPDGAITVIPPLPGGSSSRATAINNADEVLGQSAGQGYIWKNGRFKSTFAITGGATRALADAGIATGQMDINGSLRAMRWKEGKASILSPIGDFLVSGAWDVDDAGMVVGASQSPSPGGGFVGQPTIWIDDAPTSLPLPPRCVHGVARSISSTGVIVGQAYLTPSISSAIQVIWVDGAVFAVDDLTVPGSPSVGGVVAVNDFGAILVEGAARLIVPVGAPYADLTGDCAVDGADIAVILAEWGPRQSSPADLNADGIVNGFDLAFVLGDWSSGR